MIDNKQFSSRNKYIYRAIYLKTRLNHIKIKKSLNLRNSENNDSLSMNKKSLEASNLTL